MKYVKHYTVHEWKKFKHYTDDIVNGQSLTMQEILLDRYKIILTDHVNRPRVGPMCPAPLKEKFKVLVKSIPSKITQKNFDKGMGKFDNGMKEFDKLLSAFSSGTGKSDITLKKLMSKKKNNNIEKLMGKSKKRTIML